MKKCADWVESLHENGISMVFDAIANDPTCLSLGVGQPDFETPEYIRDAGIAAINLKNIGYTTDLGMYELREAISDYLKRKFNADYSPHNEIIVTNGCSQGLDFAVRCVCNPGDEFILVNPGYVAYEPLALSAGVKIVNVDAPSSVDFKVTPQYLAKVLTPNTKAILLNFPSNPTGGVMSYDDYAKIVPLLKENGCYIISDEIYTELTYDQHSASLTQFPEIKDQLILINGFSKAYSMTGWRLGYICASPQIIAHLRKLQTSAAIAPSTISQTAGIVALNDGDNDIAIMKAEFHKRRDYVCTRLNAMGLVAKVPQGAFYVFANCSKYNSDDYAFAQECIQKARVALLPGSCFGSNGKGFIRISYAYSMENLKNALDRIENYLKEAYESTYVL